MVRLNSASLEWSKQSGSQQHTHTHTEKTSFFSSGRLPTTGTSAIPDRPDSCESTAHRKI